MNVVLRFNEKMEDTVSNKDHTRIGADFQQRVADWFCREYGIDFILEKKLLIGNPKKEHKFDIVSADNTIAVECKCYTWTVTGNVPSAKMGFANEAAFFLSFLEKTCDKYIVMAYSWHSKKKKTLAEYYFERYGHLLREMDIKVAEYNVETNKFRIITDETSL